MFARSAVAHSKQKRPSKPASRPQHSKRSSLSATRVALPAGTYYSIAKGLLQLRLAHEHKQYSAKLQDLQVNRSAVDQSSKPPQERACSAAERLSSLCCMMRHRVAPYHLAMSVSELVLTLLHSLPWLGHSRAEVQQLEQIELKLLLQEVAQHEQRISELTGRARQAAVVAMSKAARMQLLLAHSRHILAAGNLKSSNCSQLGGDSSLWRGVSWALFPRGIKRELQSDPDVWHSYPGMATPAPALAKAPQLQLLAHSAAASYMEEVHAYSQSSYPSFDQLVFEGLR